MIPNSQPKQPSRGALRSVPSKASTAPAVSSKAGHRFSRQRWGRGGSAGLGTPISGTFAGDASREQGKAPAVAFRAPVATPSRLIPYVSQPWPKGATQPATGAAGVQLSASIWFPWHAGAGWGTAGQGAYIAWVEAPPLRRDAVPVEGGAKAGAAAVPSPEPGRNLGAANPCDLLRWLKSWDPAEHDAAISDILNRSVWELARTPVGSRVVQEAFEVGNSSLQVNGRESPINPRRLADFKEHLRSGLKGKVQEALRSPHGNHVLQKCIEVTPAPHLQFMLEELTQRENGGPGEPCVASFAKHRFGCRVIQRLLEHCDVGDGMDSADPALSTLVDQLLGVAGTLVKHKFGNFVVQTLLEQGAREDRHKHRIAEELLRDVPSLARHRVASHVLETAMKMCCAQDQERLAIKVLEGDVQELARSKYGSFVVKQAGFVLRVRGRGLA